MGSGAEHTQGRGCMRGSLLVARPTLREEPFRRSVVLLLDHGADGALGVILNRVTNLPVGEVLPGWQSLVSGPGRLFHGGPVSMDSALGLAQLAQPGGQPEGVKALTPLLGLVDLDTDPEQLAQETDEVRVFAGYSGWDAGQLEQELAEGSWVVVDAEPADPFSNDPGSLWSRVLTRQGGMLALLSTCPLDPTMN